MARSDLNYPKIAEVWSHGRRLPYTKIDRQRAGRLRAEAGRIALDGAELRALAKTGLSFKMIGPRGHYPVDMPAALFAEVIAQGGG